MFLHSIFYNVYKKVNSLISNGVYVFISVNDDSNNNIYDRSWIYYCNTFTYRTVNTVSEYK